MNNTKNVPEIRFKGCYDEDGNWVAFTHPWEQRKLGELGEISTGSTPSTSNSAYYSEDGIPWVTPTDINELTISDTPRKLSEEGAKVGRVVPANTILCTCIASIGKNTLLTVKGSFNQQINSLTPYDENDAYFLLTDSEIWSNTMKRMAASGTMQIVNKTEFSELKTMVPSLVEQQAIGTYFHNLDHLITLHQQKVDLHEKYVRGVEQKLMSGEMRFKADDGSDFSDWEEKKLGAVCSYRRGSFPQPYGLDEWYDEINGKPFIQVADVNDDMKVNKTTKRYISKLAEEKSVFVESGTLIITLQGTIGRVAITTYDAYVDRTLLIIQNIDDCLNIEYLKLAMKSLFDVEKRKADGGIIKTITKETLTNFMFSIPCLDEQQKIADCLSVGYAVVEQDKIAIDALKKLKTYMLQKMFV